MTIDDISVHEIEIPAWASGELAQGLQHYNELANEFGAFAAAAEALRAQDTPESASIPKLAKIRAEAAAAVDVARAAKMKALRAIVELKPLILRDRNEAAREAGDRAAARRAEVEGKLMAMGLGAYTAKRVCSQFRSRFLPGLDQEANLIIHSALHQLVTDAAKVLRADAASPLLAGMAEKR